MRPFMAQLGMSAGSAIAANGAHVLGVGGSVVAIEHLADDVRGEIIDFAESRQIHINSYTAEELYFHHESKWGDLYMSRVKSVLPTPCTRLVFRELAAIKLMFVGDPEGLKHECDRIKVQLDPKRVSITFSEPEYLEFLPGGIDKAWGLRHLAEHLGIPQNEVAAAGDYHNDLAMLSWAGISAAMATAPAEVKAVATTVVPSSDDGGLAVFIDSLLNKALSAS